MHETSSETLRVGPLAIRHVRPSVERGPAVLFLHGISVDASVWAEWLPFFASRGFPAYALSLRGHGESDRVPDLGSVSMNDYIDDALSAARFIGRPAVVGHSMGGLLAQCLAARGAVRSATLVTPAPPRGIPLFSPTLAIKQLKYVPALFFNRPVVAEREEMRDIAMNCAPPDIQERALDQLVPESGRALREISIGVPVYARNVTCPIQVFAAEFDRFVPPKVVGRIAARYNAPLTVLPGRSHIVIQEPGWQSLAEQVIAFL